MTVCIAAIAMGLGEDDKKYPIIIGASDRMITAGKMEYEPELSKISRITPYIVALSSTDDVSMQEEVLIRTKSQFADNPDYYPVDKIADAHSKNLVDYKRQIQERTILRPAGFTWQTYMDRFPDETPRWFKEGMYRVFGDFDDLPATNTIIAGVDETGAHLFIVDKNGYISRQDAIGYAAIGIGGDDAESQFMFEGHTPSKSFEDTLFLTYVAKRRAEMVQGGGRETDLFYISLKGRYVELVDEKKDALKKLYDSIIGKTEREKVKLKPLISQIMKA